MKSIPVIIVVILNLSLGTGAVAAQDEALFSTQSLVPEIALKAATAALEKCRAGGYQISVAIVDRAGLLQVMLRDRFAGAHTLDTARRKAWTAASFRSDTSGIVQFIADNPQQQGLRQISEAMMIGGGKVIDAGGSLVGAIGVSGGPNPSVDEGCAVAGIEAIEVDIQF
ncbi:MAG TPA: heme-binding protein [Gammaproteobacteria bacterium]|nr:heme-binding protein [Gammaproteobacteria bacterium]